MLSYWFVIIIGLSDSCRAEGQEWRQTVTGAYRFDSWCFLHCSWEILHQIAGTVQGVWMESPAEMILLLHLFYYYFVFFFSSKIYFQIFCSEDLNFHVFYSLSSPKRNTNINWYIWLPTCNLFLTEAEVLALAGIPTGQRVDAESFLLNSLRIKRKLQSPVLSISWLLPSSCRLNMKDSWFSSSTRKTISLQLYPISGKAGVHFPALF